MTTTPQSVAVVKTLFVSDLVGSTRLVEQLGDQGAADLFARHDRIARDAVRNAGGREIDKTDGFLLLFDRPLDAVRCAFAYHAGLREVSLEMGQPVEARVGIHLGEVILRENSPDDVARGAKPLEVEGLAKPMAARLMSAALGGQTLLTQGAFDLARRAAVGAAGGFDKLEWLAHGAYHFKGVSEPIELFEVGVPGEAPLSPPPDSEKVRKALVDERSVGWRPAPMQPVPGRDHFVLDRKLGDGGFGEVWLARHRKTDEGRVFKFCFELEQLQALKREVTLFRLIRESLGNRQDIVRILDWNFEEPPYFIESEYSEGGDLNQWLEEQAGAAAVPLATRLDLVAQAAEALSAAHSVGILHKDVKPANILVTIDRGGRPHIKMADFGIGAIVKSSPAESMGITMAGFTEQMEEPTSSGTRLYMAPEILEGKRATVQADIYSLGVMLYQLVIGRMKRPLASGWERDIEDELLREDIAAMVDGSPERRMADAGEAARRLRNLEKRRADREATARRQAESERMREALDKSQRRRRISLAASFLILLVALLVGFAARRASIEAARARRAASTARRVSRFLEKLFHVDDSGKAATVTARKILDEGSRRISKELRDEPELRARLMEAMGASYLELGLLDEAEPLLRQGLESARRTEKLDPGFLAEAELNLGRLLASRGRFAESERMLNDALDRRDRRFGKESPEAAEPLAALVATMERAGEFVKVRPFKKRLDAMSGSPTLAGSKARATKGKAGGPLTLDRSVASPTDMNRLLGATTPGGLAVAAVSGGIALLPLDGMEEQKRIPLEPGTRVEALLMGQALLLRQGTTLVLRPIVTEGKELVSTVVMEGVDETSRIVTDTTLSRVAVVGKSTTEVYDVSGSGPKRLCQIPVGGEGSMIALGKSRLAAIGAGEPLRLFELPSGQELFSAVDWEGQVHAVAIDERLNLVVVGGWFDEVVAYDMATGRLRDQVATPGETVGLAILPDYPSVAIVKRDSVSLWRLGRGIVVSHVAPSGDFSFGGISSEGLLVLSEKRHRIEAFGLHDLAIERSVRVTNQAIWGIAGCGSAVFAASSDGRLHRYEPVSDRLKSRKAHTQGVTSVACRNNVVVTSSDDKTLAAWRSDDLAPLGTTHAHETLVNSLFFDRGTGKLWSVSSDGSLKAWTLPSLDPGEEIRLDPIAKATLFMDERRGIAVTGTWDHSFEVLSRTASGWRLDASIPVPSQGVYSMAEVSDLRLLVLGAVDPGAMLLFDLDAKRYAPIAPTPLVPFVVAPLDGRRVVVGSVNSVAVLGIRRAHDEVSCDWSVGIDTRLERVGAVAVLDGGARIATGSDTGVLSVIKTDSLPPTKAMRSTIEGWVSLDSGGHAGS